MDRVGILDIDTKLRSLKIKWIQRLLNFVNAPWKDFHAASTEINSEF